jgi:hypothetical protein
MVSGLVSGIVDALKQAIGQLGNIGGALGIGGGGGGGIFGGGGFLGLGFAQGGLVPAGHPNDTFPARLSSGEFVIDRSMTDRLTNFLDNFETKNSGVIEPKQPVQAQNQNLTINLSVGEQQLANVLLNLNRQGFRTA